MDEKLKNEMILVFNQGFQELVLPAVRELREEMRKSFKQVSQEFKLIGEKLDLFQEQLTNMNENVVRLDKSNDRTLDEQVDLRTRMRRIESVVFKKVN